MKSLGFIVPFGVLANSKGSFLSFNESNQLVNFLQPCSFMFSINFTRIFLASPTSGMFAGIFFPISAGSISMWTILVVLARLLGWLTALSPTLAPIKINRSHSFIVWLANFLPWVPIIPIYSLSSPWIAPIPIIVDTTGISKVFAKSKSSFWALAENTPPPTHIKGFSDCSIASTTLFICRPFPLVVGLYDIMSTLSGYSKSIITFWMSIGTSINTGPFLPVPAI